jgi:hypothetical protein
MSIVKSPLHRSRRIAEGGYGSTDDLPHQLGGGCGFRFPSAVLTPGCANAAGDAMALVVAVAAADNFHEAFSLFQGKLAHQT